MTPRCLGRILALAMLAVIGVAESGERELILVAGAESKAAKLSIAETRKLFLGLPVEKNGVTLRPVLNLSDPLLFEVFLQKVTFMSAEAYERQVLSIVFRLGGQRPESVDDPRQLGSRLAQQPDAVTFMWSSQLAEFPHLRLVAPLWSGAAD